MPPFDSPISALLLTALAAYLVGSIPFGLLVSRAMGLGDVRKIGSGNIGATNVLRTGSKTAALATVLLDAAKGLLPVLLARSYVGEDGAQVAGLAAFLGHIFPIWLRFRGGKGVATFFGVLLGLAPILGVAALATWLLVFIAFRISSLSGLSAALIPVPLAFLVDLRHMLVLLIFVAAMLYWKHRSNIGRLLKGEEPPTSWSKK